jgi:hypothetical protein
MLIIHYILVVAIILDACNKLFHICVSTFAPRLPRAMHDICIYIYIFSFRKSTFAFLRFCTRIMACQDVAIPAPLRVILQGISDKYMSDVAGGDNQIVSLKDEFFQALTEYRYMYIQEVHVKHMGVNPKNRGGEGISWHRAQTRLSMIKSSGFSLSAIEENSVASEDHPTTKHIETFTLEQCKLSDRYARYVKGEVKFGSLGAGHANHGFAQLYDLVPCDIPNISEGGVMSQDKCFKDRGIMKATTKGNKYKIIRWEIEANFPELMDLVQSALNTVSQSGEGEKWPQMLLKIVAEAKTHSSCASIPWEKVTRAVLKSNPPRMEDVHGQVEFVRYWGGLPSGFFVSLLNKLVHRWISAERIVAGNFFECIAKMKFGVDDRPSFFIAALVFTHAKADKDITDGISRYITKGDIDMCTTKLLPLVKEANGYLLRGNAAIDQHAPDRKIELLGPFMEQIVKAVMPKTCEAMPSLMEIAADFTASFTSTSVNIPAPKPDTRSLANAIEFDEHGRSVNVGKATVMNKGFNVGLFVSLKKGKDTNQWQIVEIAGCGDVIIAPVMTDGTVSPEIGSHTRIVVDDFLERYREVAHKLELLEGYPANDALATEEFHEVLAKSSVAFGLVSLAAQYGTPADLRPILKPSKAVFTKASFGAGELVLVPSTTSMSCDARKNIQKDLNKLCISCEVAHLNGRTLTVTLNPIASGKAKSGIVWLIASKPNKCDCNCELVTKTVVMKMPSHKAQNANPKFDVRIPCIVNFKKIQQGEELVLHRVAQAAKDAKRKTLPELEAKDASKPKAANCNS